jgi:uncharacterized protein YndB with AHSA1/START domain
MQKLKFIAEFELRASPKMLFPYISSASGLSQWFAEKVNLKPEQRFDFHWDGENHPARQVSLRLNKIVKFDFTDTSDDNHDNNYVEFRIDVSDMTGTTFLHITDYSSNTDAEELQYLWEGFMDRLKEIIGS